MTRKERMRAALSRRPVDRVPFSTYNMHPYSDNTHTRDATYAPLLEKVRTSAGVAIKHYAPGVGVALSADPPGLLESRAEGSGDDCVVTCTLHTPKGELTSIRRAPENKPGMTVKHFITSDAEMEAYMSIPYHPPTYDTTALRALYQAVGDRGLIFVGFSEPMYAVAGQFDFEDFTILCVTDLPRILRFIDWALERAEANLRLLLRACQGMQVSFHTSGPEVCTPPMLSPALFPKLVTPGLRRLAGVIHDAGFPCAVHCHGHVREIFPEMLRSGVDLLEPIEPPEQGNITLAELMEQAAGRICLMGHIQDQELYTARPGEMARKVEAIARVVNERTGYIMTPTCTPFQHPAGETYRRNYLEWLEAAERQFGS